MKTKHTRGPWQLLPNDTGKDYLRVRGTILGDRWKIADVPKFPQDAFAEETEANARLITAAPLLLSALRAVEWEGSGGGVRVCPKCRYLHREHRPDCTLHAAIIAAEGVDNKT